ncbi:MAG: hypothetical protein MUF62_03590 [Chitinophagaceae bacterium]|jgi:hypothetical protein|nr:hypothetical protein [Chitinophagaceae bacterium]
MKSSQHWIKTSLYLLPAILLLATAISKWAGLDASAVWLLALSVPCLALAAFHHRVRWTSRFKTPLLLFVESVLLSVAAWLLYRQGLYKATFMLEGFSAFYLSMAALALALYKRRPFSVADVA